MKLLLLLMALWMASPTQFADAKQQLPFVNTGKRLALKNFRHLHHHRLNVKPHATLELNKEVKCTTSCMKNEECVSLNVMKTPDNKFVCELLNTSKYRHKENLTQDDSYVHWYLEDPCLPSPCQNDGKCVRALSNMKETDVTCVCTTEFIGNFCEIPLYSTCTNPQALGMESGSIPDTAITASSSYDNRYVPQHSRLRSSKGSCSWTYAGNVDGTQSWLQVDLGKRTIVTGVATQGSCTIAEWVTTYDISHSNDETAWTFYEESQAKKIFNANTDQTTVVTNLFNPPFVARYVRVSPKTWKSYGSIRIEYYGCHT